MLRRTRPAGAVGGRSGRVAAAAVLAVLLALPACSAEPGERGPESPAGAAEVPGATPTTTAAPTPGDAEATLPPAPPAPTDDAASDEAALAAGTAAVTAFARPDLPADRWWSELQPLLSAAASEAYVGTDPAQVPAHAVTGPSWPGESSSAYLALTFVPTDAGDYAVLLVRDGGGTPWLVERITLVPADASATATPQNEDQAEAAGAGA